MTSNITIQAVIFDVDGTLIDTSEYLYQAFEYVLAKHDCPAGSRKDIASQIGKKLEECYAFLAPSVAYQALKSDHDWFQGNNLPLIKPFAAANDVIAELHAKGLRLVIWTGRSHLLPESLEVAGIDTSLFELVIDPTMTKHGKPDPEGVFLALDTLQLVADEAVIVGDAQFDILAGRQAKLRATIGITHGFGSRKELEDASADYLIDSLQELPGVIKRLEHDG